MFTASLSCADTHEGSGILTVSERLSILDSTLLSVLPHQVVFSEGPEGEARAELLFSPAVVGDSGRYRCSGQFEGWVPSWRPS